MSGPNYVILPDKEAANALAAFHAENRLAALAMKPAIVDELDIHHLGSTSQTMLLRLTDDIEPLLLEIIESAESNKRNTSKDLAGEVSQLLDRLSTLNNHISTYGGTERAASLFSFLQKLKATHDSIMEERKRVLELVSLGRRTRAQESKIKVLRKHLQDLIQETDVMLPVNFEEQFRDHRIASLKSQRAVGYNNTVGDIAGVRPTFMLPG